MARDIIRQATARVFKKYFDGVPLHPIVRWFELGGTLKYSSAAPGEEVHAQLKNIQGLFEKTQTLGLKAKEHPALLVAGAEFILEGLYALKKISRNEEVGYFVEERRAEMAGEEPGRIRPGPRRRPIN